MSFRKRALIRIVLLGCFFLALYSACNFITSLRSDIGVLYFEWEKQISFVPWLIISYVSLYPLFITSALLIENDSELDVVTKRVIFAVIVSTVCFLVFPLRLGFERPEVVGFFNPIFVLQDSLTDSYNLAPALHVSLSFIIWKVYHEHTHRFIRFTVGVWFLMIVLSTFFTYQHHLVDIISAAAVGLASLYLFRSLGP